MTDAFSPRQRPTSTAMPQWNGFSGVAGNSVEAFEEFIRRDGATLAKMVVQAGIKRK